MKGHAFTNFPPGWVDLPKPSGQLFLSPPFACAAATFGVMFCCFRTPIFGAIVGRGPQGRECLSNLGLSNLDPKIGTAPNFAEARFSNSPWHASRLPQFADTVNLLFHYGTRAAAATTILALAGRSRQSQTPSRLPSPNSLRSRRSRAQWQGGLHVCWAKDVTRDDHLFDSLRGPTSEMRQGWGDAVRTWPMQFGSKTS